MLNHQNEDQHQMSLYFAPQFCERHDRFTFVIIRNFDTFACKHILIYDNTQNATSSTQKSSFKYPHRPTPFARRIFIEMAHTT